MVSPPLERWQAARLVIQGSGLPLDPRRRGVKQRGRGIIESLHFNKHYSGPLISLSKMVVISAEIFTNYNTVTARISYIKYSESVRTLVKNLRVVYMKNAPVNFM